MTKNENRIPSRGKVALRILCALAPHAGTISADDDLVEVSVRLADRLVARLTPSANAPAPVVEPDLEQALNDATALAVLLHIHNPGTPQGPRRVTWASACEQAFTGGPKLGRRAFDSARARLLLAGKIWQNGSGRNARFLPVANTPSI